MTNVGGHFSLLAASYLLQVFLGPVCVHSMIFPADVWEIKITHKDKGKFRYTP